MRTLSMFGFGLILLAAGQGTLAADYPVGGYKVTLGRLKYVGMSDDSSKWCAAGIRVTQSSPNSPFLDVCFMPTGIPLPANTSNGNTHVSYRPISEYPYYLDLLRNERQLHMTLDPARPDRHSIRKG